MAADFFLKIDGIAGDSVDPQHKGEIELLSFNWGESNNASAAHGAAGGAAAGKVAVQDFNFRTKTGSSSPRLMLACSTALIIKEATVSGRKAGMATDFMKFKLNNLLVSSYQIGLLNPPSDRPTAGLLNPPSDRPASGASDPPPEMPTDSFSLNFARLEFEVTPQLGDGSVSQAVKGVVTREPASL